MLETDIGVDPSEKQDGNALLSALAPFAHWVLWRIENVDGKLTKVPYQSNGQYAKVSDPATWSTYEAANAVLAGGGKYDGLGFVLTEDDPFTCVDIDDKENIGLDAFQRSLLDGAKQNTYVEISPSGLGYHIWLRGTAETCTRYRVEVYSKSRYITVTGNALSGCQQVIFEGQEGLDWIVTQLKQKTNVAKAKGNIYPEFEPTQSNAAIMANAFAAKNRDKFARLWFGEWQELYPSQSEADSALVFMLSHWTDSKEQVRVLFRKSMLGQRDKAKRDDYVNDMIADAFGDKFLPLDKDPLTKDLIAYLDRQWEKIQAEWRDNYKDPRKRIISKVTDIPLLSEYGETDTRYVVDKLIPEGALVLIAGEPGCGKTTVFSVIANAISTGGEFLNRQCQQRDVLFLDRENPLPVVKKRFKDFRLKQDNPGFRYFGQYTATPVPQANELYILEWAKSLDVPPVIMIDGLTAFLDGGDETRPEITRPWFNLLTQLRQIGCSVVIFHHTGKGDSTKEYRGGVDIKAAIDNGFNLHTTYTDDKKFEDLMLVSFDKQRYEVDARIEFKCADGEFVSKSKANTTSVTDRGQLSTLLFRANGWSKNKFEKEAIELGMTKLKIRSFLNDAAVQKAISYSDGPHGAKIISLLITGAK